MIHYKILTRKLRLSINPSLIDKNESNDTTLYKQGWLNRELTPDQLAERINKGIAYCCELSGPRNAKNFVCSDVLSADIDGTRTITEAMDDPIVKSHLTIFYTTPSHKENRPRFRLVFALPRPIESAKEMVAAYRSLALRLGADRSATDAARLFYGSRGSNPQIFDRGLSAELLDELITQGLDADQREASSHGVVATISKQTFDLDKPVRLATGQTVAFRELQRAAAIYCPFHFDENASAFVVKSNGGSLGIRCSTCVQTFWPMNTRDTYDFADFDNRLKETEAYFEKNKDIGSFQKFLGVTYQPGLERSHVFRQSNQFLTLPSKLPDGLVFIKSPKGTGKTEGLRQIIRDENKSVLLIGHRIALIRQSCERLDLECYLDFMGPIAHKRLGICLDSIHRLTWRQYVTSYESVTKENLFHTIIIDEAEQVLSHFLSDTIEYASRDKLFKIFAMLLREAPRVIALDADLGWLTFETISKLAQPAEGRGKAQRPSTIFFNDWLTASNVQLFASKDHLIGDLMQSISDGLRVFVVSNSMKLVTSLSEGISETFREVRSILITSETVQDDTVKAFVKNSSRRALDYDAILTSPSLGTGIDITFESAQKLIDVVYGFFEGGITTHFDCDQQLGRVRHPGAVKAWVSPQRFSFDTARDVVKREIQENGMYKSVLSDFDENRLPQYHTDDPLIDMAALIRSQQLASKNNLKNNFIALKRRQGCEVEFVDSDINISRMGSVLREEGSARARQKTAQQILNAPVLNRDDFEEIERRITENEEVSKTEHYRLIRTQLEVFYREQVSAKLIENDDRGRLRKKIRRFEDLQRYAATLKVQSSTFRKTQEEKSKKFMREQALRHRFLRDEREVAGLLHELLEATPIYDDGKFDVRANFSKLDLKKLMKKVHGKKPTVENVLELEVRASEEEGVSQLGTLLKVVGLAQEMISKTKAKAVAGGATIYQYRLNENALAMVEAIVMKRKLVGGWEFVNRSYEFAQA